MRCLEIFCLIFLICMETSLILCFEDYSIFDEEDIYKTALVNPTQNDSGLTFPGTNWCGPGNTAKNFNDLGSYAETDRCCRTHDHCSEIIEPGRSMHGLQNPDMFPRLRCDCEQELLNCLQAVNDYVSLTIGKTYFTARKLCFALDHPTTGCVNSMTSRMFGDRCVKYKFDISRAKKWQYFDIPYYSAQ